MQYKTCNKKGYHIGTNAHSQCILGSMCQTCCGSAAPHCSKLTQKHVDSTVATGVATEMAQLLHGYFGLISMHHRAIPPSPPLLPTFPLCCLGCPVGEDSSLNIITWLLKGKAEIMKKKSVRSV